MTWDAPTVLKLLAAHRAGGNAAALAAFPDLRRAQVLCAIRRYVDASVGEPTPLLPASEIHARIAALPSEVIFERVRGLLEWSPLRGSVPTQYSTSET